jgi:hypothetical protein
MKMLRLFRLAFGIYLIIALVWTGLLIGLLIFNAPPLQSWQLTFASLRWKEALAYGLAWPVSLPVIVVNLGLYVTGNWAFPPQD